MSNLYPTVSYLSKSNQYHKALKTNDNTTKYNGHPNFPIFFKYVKDTTKKNSKVQKT